MHAEQAYHRLKATLRIDLMRLDDELVHHPMLLQEITEHAADAIQVRDATKADLDAIIADAANRLRVPGEDGKLPSEAKINSMTPLDKQVVQARMALEEAVHDCAYWTGLVGACAAKGSSLKRICEMTIAGFLAPSQVVREQMNEKRQRVKLTG